MVKDPSHPVYRGLCAASVPRALRLLRSGAAILCFHNVVPGEDAGQGDRSLHMDVDDFERLIDWASLTYRIVPLADLVERTRNQRSVRGLLALTFDDANRGLVRYGLPVLARRGLPGTVFVVSSMAADPRAFWWDVLSQQGRLSEADRALHLENGRGLESEILGDARTSEDVSPETIPEMYLPAGWAELGAAVLAHDALSIGAHTKRHPNLTRLSTDELQDELVGARRTIAERLEQSVDIVSYPYGLHDRRVRQASASAGYRAGLTLEPGLWTSKTDPMRIPRINIPATIGRSAFECWLAGVKPRRGS